MPQLERIEYLEYFSDGPISVSVKFAKRQGYVGERRAAPAQVGEFIEWLREHPSTPVFFDEHPYFVSRIEYVVSRGALVLHVADHV